MAVKMRLKRVGKKRSASYRLIVSEGKYAPSGRFIEELGYYDPTTEPETYDIDEDKAMKYYRELMNSEYFGGHVEHYIYPAEILMDQWGSGPKKEARSLLKKAINSPIGSDYWKNYARQLLEDL